MEPNFKQQHFTIQQLAGLWARSSRTVSRILDEYERLHPGRIPVRQARLSRFGRLRRSYRTRMVPESEAQRIYNELLLGMR